MARLQRIDDLVRKDHYYLAPEDTCYYWGEYTARKGFSYSETNNLIINFKKSPLKRARPAEWRHKEAAIAKAANIFRDAIKPEAFPQLTLVPIPPSKAKNDAEYDDRLVRMLELVAHGRNGDLRELVIQTRTIDAAHDSVVRPTPDELTAIYAIDEQLAQPTPRTIFIFDDVLTTGCHFKAMQRVLSRRFPAVPIVGFFIARRVPDTTAIEDFDQA